VQKDVAVGVAGKTFVVFDRDAADTERNAGFEFV
jgi:hypothetical protein